MIYLIKIAYSLLFPPGIFFIALFVLCVYFFRKKDRIGAVSTGILAILLAVSSMPAAGKALLHGLEYRYTPTSSISADVLVMLCGGASLDSPDPASGGSGHPSAQTAARLLTLAELYRQTGLPIVISGGQVFSDTGNESQIARRNLIAIGIPESAITIDDTSRNTDENAENTKEILEKKGWKQPLLLTSAFHMPRSVKHFQKLGISVLPFPTDYFTNQKQQFYSSQFVPSFFGLNMTGTALKEYLGLAMIR